MSSGTLTLVILVAVVVVAGFILRMLRPRRAKEGPYSEDSTHTGRAVLPLGSAHHHDGGFSSHADMPGHHGGADGGGASP